MGNSFVCSASGERLVSAARDGDLVEARMLLDCNPYLSKYFTFGGLNSPLHFAAAKGHIEIVTLLLENGADVNSRNYCGQTALMQACRYGHWEVVQTLLLFRCNVTRADYLSGRTALHFAAIGGHVSCIRLIVADFLTSAPCDGMNGKGNNEQSALSKFVNRAGDGGITGLHTAALNGYFDCVQLLLDLQADVSAVTFPYGTSMDVIGAGSTPLHYAACGGNLKCCQILIARGGSCLKLNCIGLLPLDIAKMWGRNLLETLLTPSSDAAIPVFPPSKYLSLPLLSMLNIARDCGLQSLCTSDETETCAVCLERACSVSAKGCGHELCIQCALYLCSTSSVSSETVGPPGSIPCPFCRHPITSFRKVSESPAKEIKLPKSLGLCSPCMMHHESDPNSESPTRTHDLRKARFISATSDLLCPMTCTLLFPLVSIPVCTCNDGPCLSCRSEEEDTRDCSSPPSEEEETIRPRVERTSRCLRMFWGRRSGTREHQCDSEINA